MEKARRLHNFFIIAAASVVMYLKGLVEKSSFADKVSDIGNPEFVIWVIMTVVLIFLVQLTSILFKKHLWRLFYPHEDLNGVWQYTNRYKDGRSDTTGTIEIIQDAFSIKLKSGESDDNSTNNNHKSRWWSVSATYNDVRDEIHMYYQVMRMGSDDVTNALKHSTEELKVTRWERGKLWFVKRPVELRGRYRNCLPNASDQAAFDIIAPDGWATTTGDSAYMKVN